MRLGFGIRHSAITTLLAQQTPVARNTVTWLNGTLPVRISAYTTTPELPAELVTSVRCLVRVGGEFVLCENAEGCHLVPGGRRQSGESYRDTAVREVHEETGWLVRPGSLRTVGWLHLENLGTRPRDESLPYPDFLQIVLCGVATERDGGADTQWTDTDGWETGSRLVSPAEARSRSSNDMLDVVYLDAITQPG